MKVNRLAAKCRHPLSNHNSSAMGGTNDRRGHAAGGKLLDLPNLLQFAQKTGVIRNFESSNEAGLDWRVSCPIHYEKSVNLTQIQFENASLSGSFPSKHATLFKAATLVGRPQVRKSWALTCASKFTKTTTYWSHPNGRMCGYARTATGLGTLFGHEQLE